MVDAGLPANGRVDLREQRRGHLHERHAALVDRRGEARDVANDAAAQRDERRRALSAQFEKAREHVLQRRPVLVCLAVGHSTISPARRPRPRGLPQRREPVAATVALVTMTARARTACR